jgi:two-component system, NtrC family, sensor kinase
VDRFVERAVKKHWTIRKKMLIGIAAIAVPLALLTYSSVRGAYSYRGLAAAISFRAAELPLSNEVTESIDELRFRSRSNVTLAPNEGGPIDGGLFEREKFLQQMQSVRDKLLRYEKHLHYSLDADPLLADRSHEIELVKRIEESLASIQKEVESSPSSLDAPSEKLASELNKVRQYGHKLPMILQQRMVHFRDEVRVRYRTWIVISGLSMVLASILLGTSIVFLRLSVVAPFKRLLDGCRRVARGEFDHRIDCKSNDEISELAAAMNQMTDSFVRIRNNLNREVQQRTREVVRSEQLASVGFLAAGVAHEINNPLASIAWSAEALEQRLYDVLTPRDGEDSTLLDQDQINILKTYLRRIQDEAFRCKGITERLLDFSRMGDIRQKQPTDIAALTEDVIAMIKHLGQYRQKQVRVKSKPGLVAWVIPQEIKQVILNLITNALDSLDPNGTVDVTVDMVGTSVRLVIEDNGCGMTAETLQHLFEPFFTRRRDGKGTGLGLSISYRIVQDHGGQIVPFSKGPGQGSRFEVILPKNEPAQSHEKHSQAA